MIIKILSEIGSTDLKIKVYLKISIVQALQFDDKPRLIHLPFILATEQKT